MTYTAEFKAFERFSVWAYGVRTAVERRLFHVTRDGRYTVCGRPVVAGSLRDFIPGAQASYQTCRKCRS